MTSGQRKLKIKSICEMRAPKVQRVKSVNLQFACTFAVC